MASIVAPREVMTGLSWNFIRRMPASIGDVAAELKSDSQSKIVLPFSRFRAAYTYWRGDEEREDVVELQADNPKGFTAAEVLFKLHGAIGQNLDESDHHFFQGLVLNTNAVAGEPPLYVIWLGS